VKQIIIWRHGQTDWNLENRFQGHSDIPLNTVGHYQAKQAAQVLRDMEPTAIIASDLGRARSTAEALASVTGLEIKVDQRLRETNGGAWEGKTGAQNRAEDYERFIRWIDGNDDPAGGSGERRSEVAQRASTAIFSALDLMDRAREERLVVVTHGGTARCVLGSLLSLPLTSWGSLGGLANASWSVLSENQNAEVLTWLLAEHNAFTIPEPVLGEESGGNDFV
jgi:broad specificity phosphatase PhoE